MLLLIILNIITFSVSKTNKNDLHYSEVAVFKEYKQIEVKQPGKSFFLLLLLF